jgi:phosphatidylserine/phosphatidylglycerophosphate/cardiolipin synthase-like enzyme
VCVDGALALCGGMDLTALRWDLRTHDPDLAARVDARGKAYPPKHDVMLAVDGGAARALSDLARARWEDVTEEHLEPEAADGDPWPAGLAAPFRDVEVGIARTCASAQGTIREAEALMHDALDAAREHVYIEAQYLTSRKIGEHVAKLLARPQGPAIVPWCGARWAASSSASPWARTGTASCASSPPPTATGASGCITRSCAMQRAASRRSTCTPR